MPVRSLSARRAAPTFRLRKGAAAGLIAGLLASAGAARADLYIGEAVTRDIRGQMVTSGATTDAPAVYTATDGFSFALSQTSSASGGGVLARASGLEGGGRGTALLRYLVTLVGPEGDPIGVNVQANGYVQGSGKDLNTGENLYSARAAFLLRTPTVIQVIADTRIPTGPQAFALNTMTFFAPNVGYYVDLTADAGAGAPHGYLTASTAEAFVDPIFTVDPAFAALYHFEGVPFEAPTAGGVPEPSTWAMTLLGFAGLGAALRSGRRNPASGRRAAAVTWSSWAPWRLSAWARATRRS